MRALAPKLAVTNLRPFPGSQSGLVGQTVNMALVLKSLYDGWNRNFHENQGRFLWLECYLILSHWMSLADLRSADYFLMNPPWFPFVLVAGYLYFVLDFGPKFMANRKPFNLKKLILVYNVVQVLINLVMFVLVCLVEVLEDRCLSSFSLVGFPTVGQDPSIPHMPTRQLLHRS